MIRKCAEFYIVCDECDISSDQQMSEWTADEDKDFDYDHDMYPLEGYDKRAELKKAAKEEGWTFKQGGLSYCPRCTKKLGLTK